MASPFKFFRKNQKLWLAGLTILAMGGFVVLPTLLQMMGRGRTAAARREVVSTKRYGSLDEMAISRLQRDRQTVLRFLSSVDERVRENRRNNQQNWRSPTVAQIVQRRLSPDREAIVQTWLLANRADELGIVVDDSAVNAFIEQVTEGAVTRADLIGTGNVVNPETGERDHGILGRIGLPESELFRLLKYELKALRLQDLVYTSLMPTTPGERWDYYQRLHRNMSIELAELPVERFTAGVPDPDEATIEKFFERYREKENIPESPEPGFRVPKRIALEYFKVDYEHLFEPGELEKYYEEHKDEFKREKLPEAEPSNPAPDLKGSLPGLDDMQLDVPTPGNTAPEAAEAPSSKTEPAKADAAKETSANPESSEANDVAPKRDQAKPEGNAPEKKAEDAPKPTDGTRAAGRSLFQLTAYPSEEESAPASAGKGSESPNEKPAEEPEADKKPAEAKKEAPKTDTAVSKDQASEQKPAEKKPTDEKASDEKPAGATPGSKKPAEPTEGVKPESPNPPTEEKPQSEAPPEYYTFDEVKSQIESRLAPDKIEKLFRPLENKMTLYHDAQIRYIREQDEEGNSSVPEPPRPDFAKLAAEAGIEAKKTELFSQREAMGLKLGILRSNVRVGDSTTPFLRYAFESLPEFRPTQSQDVEGNYYLFWKTQEESERVPELDDKGVRAMVIKSWKMIQARGAAQEKAESLAAEVRSKEQSSKEPLSLAAALAGEKDLRVQSTEPFTWFDSISIQLTMMGYGQPRLSSIELVAPEPKEGEKPAEKEAVPFAGADFMRAVSSLQKGETGIAWNEPKTAVYVVRMADSTPDAKELQSLFLSAANPQQLEIVAQIDRRDELRQWIDSLETSVGFEWRQ